MLKDRGRKNANQRAYRKRHPDKIKAANKEYKEKNKDRISEYNRTYVANNREKVNKLNARKRSEYRRNSPQFRIAENLRSRFRASLSGNKKTTSVIDLIGCSLKQFREHIESQFTDGMSWSNYGQWHLDHIKPLRAFDLQDIRQQREAWHYTNFQPLWARENHSKGGKWSGS